MKQAISVGVVLLATAGLAVYVSTRRNRGAVDTEIGSTGQSSVSNQVSPLAPPTLVSPPAPPTLASTPAPPELSATRTPPAVNPSEEERIEAEYNKWLKSTRTLFQKMDPAESAHVKSGMRKIIEKVIRDPVGTKKEHEARVAKTQKPQPPRALVSPEKIRGYFEGERAGISPHAYVLGAFLAAEPALLAEAKTKFPGHSAVLLGSLLYGETFLHDPAGLAELAVLDRESAWPALLGARASLSAGDPQGALLHLQTALSREIKAYESQFDAAWNDMSEHLDLPWARPGQTSAGEVFRPTSSDHIEAILSSVIDYQKEHHDNLAVRLGGAALGLAERHSEFPSLVGERLALNREIELINAMGVEAAKPYLSEPPD